MTTLCESCFPDWENREVLTVPALFPCEDCGKTDNRQRIPINGDRVRCHVFRTDPRRPVAALLKRAEE